MFRDVVRGVSEMRWNDCAEVGKLVLGTLDGELIPDSTRACGEQRNAFKHLIDEAPFMHRRP